MTAAEEIERIPKHGAARMRDCDAFLAEWIWPSDDETIRQRLYLAYLKGMIDTHVRATAGEEPGLTTVGE
jgi:hypothetical protein